MRKASHRDADHYKERAEECRAIAEQFLNGETRDKMLKIAVEYEVIADSVAALGRVVDELDEFTPAHSQSRKFR